MTFCPGDTRPHLKVNVGETEIVGLLDSGATRTIFGDKVRIVLEMLGYQLNSCSVTQAIVANGEKCKIEGSMNIPIQVEGKTTVIEALYLPATSISLILGADFQRIFGIMMDLTKGRYYFTDQIQINACQPVGTSRAIYDRAHLTAEEEKKLQSLTDKYYPQMVVKYGTTNLVEHHIDTGDAAPIKQRYYPVSPNVQHQIDKELDEMICHGIIEPSQSAWASPIVLVRKPDNSYRFCVNYKKLNAVTKKDAYPLPFINQILNQLRDAKYLSSIDLKSAYWQIPVAKDSIEKTSFTVPGRGLFQFRRMPFGLTNAPATWQRLIDQILGPALEPSVFVYLDDIVVVTSTFEKHIEVLSTVFDRLIKAGLTVNKEKTRLCRSELKYLGYVVDFQGLHVDDEKVSAISKIPSPNSKKAVRSFIGATSWYRRFIPDYAAKISPLTKLIHKNVHFTWNDQAEEAFQTIKEKLIEAPILACPKFELPFELHCDACNEGIGAVLSQIDKDGEHVISYASRTLNQAEKHYNTTEKECLAVIWAIEHYRSYLEGAKFTVFTDHHSLIWLSNLKDPRGRLARWVVRLQAYDFEIKHKKGKDNAVADFLSRTAIAPANEEEIDLVTIQIKEPSTDKWYNKILQQVQSRPENFPSWKIENDQLYKFVKGRPMEVDSRFEWKLVVPKDSRKEVYQECHDDQRAGHLGFYKTYHRASLYYYWPKMKADISSYVRHCLTCQSTKPDQKRPAGLMGTMRKASNPFEVISADVIGPLPRTARGFLYILVVTDLFSKYTLLFPLRSLSSKLISQNLEENVFLVYGTPKALISDNGTEFVGAATRKLCEEYKVKMFLNARRHAQANPTERYNRTLITMIRCYVGEHHHKWDECLPKLGFALRTAKSEVTGYTPASLIFGRELFYLPEQCEESEHSESNITKHQQRLTNLKNVYEDVQRKLNLAHIKSARRYNLRRRHIEFNEGDLVWKKNYVQSNKAEKKISKFAPKYVGPYHITRKVSSLIYELEDQHKKKIGRWHVQDLKPYTEDPEDNYSSG